MIKPLYERKILEYVFFRMRKVLQETKYLSFYSRIKNEIFSLLLDKYALAFLSC